MWEKALQETWDAAEHNADHHEDFHVKAQNVKPHLAKFLNF